jgi:hypothetical protein
MCVVPLDDEPCGFLGHHSHFIQDIMLLLLLLLLFGGGGGGGWMNF